MKLLTIFTPSYNRAYTLERLYNSLKNQTNKSFVWVIIDDGSTDSTEELVKRFISEDQIKIQYHYQENSGKSQAHNRGVQMCDTELFVCVDSDDFLTNDAVEKILLHWNVAKKTEGCIGLLACKCAKNVECPLTHINTKKLPKDNLMTVREAYASGAIKGDALMIYRTSELKLFAFPRFDGEKFVPEAYLYDKLDQRGKLFYTDEKLYVAEYLDDGYTSNMESLNFKNANGYFAYVDQRLQLDTTFKSKVIDTACYISICIVLNKRPIHPKQKLLSFLVFPLGYALYLKRYHRFKQKQNI